MFITENVLHLWSFVYEFITFAKNRRENQEVRYNWKADILYTGSRSRSNFELMFWLLYSDCTIFGVIYNRLDIEVHDLRPAIYTTTTTT